MSQKGKKVVIKLARSIIQPIVTPYPQINRRFKLRGGTKAQTAAVKKASEIISTLRLAGHGRQWVRNTKLDLAVSEQRRLCSDTRLNARERIDSLVRLAVIDGFLPASELGDTPTDIYIRQLLTIAVRPETRYIPPPPEGETFSQAAGRFRLIFGMRGHDDNPTADTDSGSTPDDIGQPASTCEPPAEGEGIARVVDGPHSGPS